MKKAINFLSTLLGAIGIATFVIYGVGLTIFFWALFSKQSTDREKVLGDWLVHFFCFFNLWALFLTIQHYLR